MKRPRTTLWPKTSRISSARRNEPMFEYKARLKKIREELTDIDEGLSPIVADEAETERVKALALGICRICRILVRVIDSLPG